MKRITLLLSLLISIGFSASAAKEIIRHRIEPKETLFRIALMYNSTVNDIVKANPGMNPKSISSGTVIKVPKDTKIRDAEFVESFLNGKPEFPPISQVATLITREKPFENHIANNTTSARSSQPRKEDDNPFLTPAEPRTGPASDARSSRCALAQFRHGACSFIGFGQGRGRPRRRVQSAEGLSVPARRASTTWWGMTIRRPSRTH